MAARARYFGRFVKGAPELLWALALHGLGRKGSWITAVKDALRWVKRHCRLVDDLPDPSDSAALGAWVCFIEGNQRAWKHYVGRAACAATAARAAIRSAERDAADIIAAIKEARGEARPAADAGPGEASPNLSCSVCDKSFRSLRGLRSHEVCAHGARHPLRRRVAGSVCQACGLQVHTRPRLIYHVTRAVPLCRRWYARHAPAMSDDLVRELDARDRAASKVLRKRGRGIKWACLPAVRIPWTIPQGMSCHEESSAPLETGPGGETPPPFPRSWGFRDRADENR